MHIWKSKWATSQWLKRTLQFCIVVTIGTQILQTFQVHFILDKSLPPPVPFISVVALLEKSVSWAALTAHFRTMEEGKINTLQVISEGKGACFFKKENSMHLRCMWTIYSHSSGSQVAVLPKNIWNTVLKINFTWSSYTCKFPPSIWPAQIYYHIYRLFLPATV